MTAVVERPGWLKARERQQETDAHQALVKRDVKCGSNRDQYLLMDRIYQFTPGYTVKGITGYSRQEKPDVLVILTKKGERRINRLYHKGMIEERDENIRLKRRARRNRAERSARQAARRRRLR
jgi:hypothetical protein